MNDVTFFVRETTKSDMPTHEIRRISWSLPKNQHPSSVHRNYTARIFHQPNPNKATPFHCQCMLKSTTTKIQLLSLFSWIIRWFKCMHAYVLMFWTPCHCTMLIASFAYISHERYFNQDSAYGIVLYEEKKNTIKKNVSCVEISIFTWVWWKRQMWP